jgi:protein involved in polysaccharide export with SLBB domain
MGLITACLKKLPGWAALGTCLVSIGCQLPMSRTIISGEAETNPSANAQVRLSGGPLGPPEAPIVSVLQTTANDESVTSIFAEAATPGQAKAEQDAAHDNGAGPQGEPIPVELNKVSLPPYVIEPPDILLIDTVRMIPLPPYRVEPLDVLLIQAAEAIPNQPISGPYTVTPDGTINIGFSYGLVRVAGLSLPEVEAVLRSHLSRFLRNSKVAVAVGSYRGIQQARGEHLVTPDGTINLGTYGPVYVAGLTLTQARCVIEKHLSHYVLNPQISLSVFAYNSKVYYVIFDGGGYGQQVYRFPITGNETVLDAISNVAGLPAVASKRRLWLARPAPAGHPCDQVLPIDWLAITQGGSTATNYQLFPGDRIYVKADCLISLDYAIAKIVSPFERIFGVTILGEAAVQGFSNNGTNNGFFP